MSGCCGRLHRMVREQFREPRTPAPPQKTEHVNRVARVDPPNPSTVCPECGNGLRKLMSCCSTTYRCVTYPKCMYKEMYDKKGERR